MTVALGYFDSPYQKQPSHDPGTDVACPVCNKTLSGRLKTISLMRADDERSYLFRVHAECWEAAGSEQREIIEGSIIDGPRP